MVSHNFCSISGVFGGKNSNDTEGTAPVNALSSNVGDIIGTKISYFRRIYVATMQQATLIYNRQENAIACSSQED
jgi:hypothetical protein